MADGAAKAATASIVIEQMRGAIKSRIFRLAGVFFRAGSDVRLTRGIRRWKGDQMNCLPHSAFTAKASKRNYCLPGFQAL
jgi:hypothetical protein